MRRYALALASVHIGNTWWYTDMAVKVPFESERPRAYVCVCVYVYVYVYLCMCACVHAYMCMCLCVYFKVATKLWPCWRQSSTDNQCCGGFNASSTRVRNIRRNISEVDSHFWDISSVLHQWTRSVVHYWMHVLIPYLHDTPHCTTTWCQRTYLGSNS